ncbi:MAG TPA: sigma-70 family RNA polymerase sigma factor [Solirubrobacteraceae bacterium]|nr:sigma-70 family RNA polymerase sigma factor [Solirubrobacteraceae bacterium]
MNPGLIPPSRLARSVLRTQSDERLTELARAGSDAAFEALVARYRHALLRRCARVVGDTDADEAVQDALLRAHAALARGEPVRNVRPWLHAIAHNSALNLLRARASRPECVPNAREAIDQEDHAPQQREQLREVLTAVAELPARQRDAIVMRELEGRSYEEIAAQLGTTGGAVRQLLNRARNAMRDRLGALAGATPLLRWALDTGNGAAVARIGALSGGCALTAKLCTAALVPGVVGGIAGVGAVVGGAGGVGAVVGGSSAVRSTATHTTRQHRTAARAPAAVDTSTRDASVVRIRAAAAGASPALAAMAPIRSRRVASVSGPAPTSDGGTVHAEPWRSGSAPRTQSGDAPGSRHCRRATSTTSTTAPQHVDVTFAPREPATPAPTTRERLGPPTTAADEPTADPHTAPADGSTSTPSSVSSQQASPPAQ